MRKYSALISDRKTGQHLHQCFGNTKMGLRTEIVNKLGFLPPENHRRFSIAYQQRTKEVGFSPRHLPTDPNEDFWADLWPQNTDKENAAENRNILTAVKAIAIGEENQEILFAIAHGNSTLEITEKKAREFLVEKLRNNSQAKSQWIRTEIKSFQCPIWEDCD